MMNLNINILTIKGITNLENFLSFYLFYHKFQKVIKTVLMAVTDYAIEDFLLSLNA